MPPLAQQLHVEIPRAAHPLVGLLGAQGRHEPQASLPVGPHPHHRGPPLDLSIERLQPVGSPYPLPVLGREREDREALLDVLVYVGGDLSRATSRQVPEPVPVRHPRPARRTPP